MEFIAVVEHMFHIYEPLHTDTSTQIQTLHVLEGFYPTYYLIITLFKCQRLQKHIKN